MTRMVCAVGVALFGVAAFGQSTSRAFEVASIRPSQTPQGRGLPSLREDVNTSAGTLTMRNVTLTTTIRWAYKLSAFEISGPQDLADARYDITAKPAAPVTEDQLRVMLQTLLTERFKLAFHRQTQDVPGYVFVIGKNGPKLTRRRAAAKAA